jgi:hypothetical protein
MRNLLLLFVCAVVFSACGQSSGSDAILADTTTTEKDVHATLPDTNQLTTSSKEQSTTATTSKWNGKYTAYFSYGEIAGVNAGWELTINVSPDSVTAMGEGYQMYFKDRLKPIEKQNQLELHHVRNVFGYKQGKEMTPEFTITESKGKFYVKSNWMGAEVQEKSTKMGYLIEKK